MKPRCLFGSVVFLSLSLSRAFAASPDSLLADTIEHPKGYTQLCIASPAVPRDIPIPAAPNGQNLEVNVSSERMEVLLKNRPAIMPALARLLDAIDPARTVETSKPKLRSQRDPSWKTVVESGVSPHEISSLLLQILGGTNALETLPNLLALEDRLNAAIERADRDPQAPVAHVARDCPFIWQDRNEGIPEREKQQAHARFQQREMLSLMLELLRRQKFQPLLQSGLERNIVRQTARAKKNDGDRESLEAGVPYSARTREQVRGLVEQFIRTVPKSQWIPASS